MSSVAKIHALSREVGPMLAPNKGWKAQVNAIHREITDKNFEHSLPGLTWNRVKSWFFGANRRVDYEEVVALEELKALEEARRDHQQFLATTNRLAAALASEGASLSRRQMEALARISRRSPHAAGDQDAGSRGNVVRMARPRTAA